MPDAPETDRRLERIQDAVGAALWLGIIVLLFLLASSAGAQSQECVPPPFQTLEAYDAFVFDAGDAFARVDTLIRAVALRDSALARTNALAQDLTAQADTLSTSLLTLGYALQDERRACDADRQRLQGERDRWRAKYRRQRLVTLGVLSASGAALLYTLTR